MNVANKETKHPPASLEPKPYNLPSFTIALKGSFVYAEIEEGVKIYIELLNRVII